MHKIMYGDFLKHWYRQGGPKIKLGLETVRLLLKHVGSPQCAMPNVLVAGTNGKGSTTQLIASTLALGAYKTGIYTSPHLLRFSERIRINGTEISEQDVIRLGNKLLQVAQAHHLCPSFFELTTALAWLYFAEQGVDIAVFEVGLGGRLDATNVCDKTLSIITPIDLDHQAILGNKIAQIAMEKAGIIQAQRPIVCAEQKPQAQAVIEQVAKQQHAPLYTAQSTPCTAAIADWIQHAAIAWYQKRNFQTAQCALEVLHQQGFTTTTAQRLQAMQQFAWPGRFQWLQPQHMRIPQAQGPVVLDGGHNPAGAQALVQALSEDPRSRQQPCHVIFSAVDGKDAPAMCNKLRPYVTTWRVCPNRSARALAPTVIANAVGPEARIFDHFVEAFDDACIAQQQTGGFILVFGSLFLIGEALAYLTQSPQDPSIDG